MVLQTLLFRSKERSQPRILRASWTPPSDIQVHIFGRSDIQCNIHAQGDCILPHGSRGRGFQGVRGDELIAGGRFPTENDTIILVRLTQLEG